MILEYAVADDLSELGAGGRLDSRVDCHRDAQVSELLFPDQLRKAFKCVFHGEFLGNLIVQGVEAGLDFTGHADAFEFVGGDDHSAATFASISCASSQSMTRWYVFTLKFSLASTRAKNLLSTPAPLQIAEKLDRRAATKAVALVISASLIVSLVGDSIVQTCQFVAVILRSIFGMFPELSRDYSRWT